MERPEDDEREYRVLVNAEEQYSLWLAALSIPNGWTDTGVRGSKATCLKHVDEVWTDMRPKSLRVSRSA
jgi:MbtH protein